MYTSVARKSNEQLWVDYAWRTDPVRRLADGAQAPWDLKSAQMRAREMEVRLAAMSDKGVAAQTAYAMMVYKMAMKELHRRDALLSDKRRRSLIKAWRGLRARMMAASAEVTLVKAMSWLREDGSEKWCGED